MLEAGVRYQEQFGSLQLWQFFFSQFRQNKLGHSQWLKFGIK